MNKFQIDRVPQGLRGRLEGASAWLPQFIQANAECDSIDELLAFIGGALRHQAQLAEDRSGGLGTVSFAARLLDVKVIERKSKSGNTLGRKGELSLEAISGRKAGDEETITTSWTSGGGADPFELALSRTIVDVARANPGAEVLVTKRTTENGEGEKFKTILDLRVLRAVEGS